MCLPALLTDAFRPFVANVSRPALPCVQAEDMPRRATRSAFFSVKKEASDAEEADVDAVPHPAPESSNRLAATRALRSGPTAAPAAASAGAAPASSSSASGAVPTSRFFASPSPCAAPGRKRKAAAERGGTGATLPSARSGLRRAVAVKEELTDQEAQRAGGEQGGFKSGVALPGSEPANARDRVAAARAGAPAAPTAAVGAQRRSRRLDAVKKEELVDPPARFPAAVGGAPADGGVGAQQTQKKRRGAVKQEAHKKVKAGARGGGGAVREKPVPPRLAEKAALILQVMDKLYPDPPIPINHLVSRERVDPSFGGTPVPTLLLPPSQPRTHVHACTKRCFLGRHRRSL